ncbi:MAG TPA: 50S ribosomal protein L35 [Gaiellaceae bacterium]|nr:50S ribosomal protein L35 [Gaiellaceae bacterium]
MPKQKTKSSAKKRFKVTGSGKIMRRPTMRSHNLEHKPAKQKRKFRRELQLAPSDVKTLKQLLRVK